MNRRMRWMSVAVASAGMALAGCGSDPQPATRKQPPSPNSTVAESLTAGVSTSPTSGRTPALMSADEMVRAAEMAAEDELPDAPIWKGMTFTGVPINDSTVCVDRTWREGGGVDHRGGNAGYVIVRFPGPTLADPVEGFCPKVPSSVR